MPIRPRDGHADNVSLDFTASNILHWISGLDSLTETEILQVFGTPRRNKVLDEEGQPRSEPTAPEYLVYPIRWADIDPQHIANQACLIDFGESFKVSHPPEELGTPGPYRSPELILDNSAGIASDLWALGCTLFEIRTGRKLISPFGDEDGDYLESVVLLLGRLPEPWWSTTWKGRKRLFKDEEDDSGRAVPTAEPPSTDARRTVHPSVADGARPLQDMLAPGLWYMSDERRGGDHHRDIQPQERELFADLLAKLLDLRPGSRLGAGAALEHAWFKI